MIDKVFEWTIAIILGALGICPIIVGIVLLIAMLRSFFD